MDKHESHKILQLYIYKVWYTLRKVHTHQGYRKDLKFIEKVIYFIMSENS